MWCGTVDYTDAEIILKKYGFKKSDNSSITEWFLHDLGKQKLTVRFRTNHWCGVHVIHNHFIEVFDTKGKTYHYMDGNDGKYVMLAEILPNKSPESLENRLIAILLKFGYAIHPFNLDIIAFDKKFKKGMHQFIPSKYLPLFPNIITASLIVKQPENYFFVIDKTC